MDENIRAEINKEKTKNCRYCGRELNTNFDFCIYCGKNQSDVPSPVKPLEEKRKISSVIKAGKKSLKDKVLLILSLVCFAIGLVFFAIGIVNWAGIGVISAGSVFGNLFGSVDVSSYIIAFINIVSSFLSAVVFILGGMAFQLFRRK